PCEHPRGVPPSALLLGSARPLHPRTPDRQPWSPRTRRPGWRASARATPAALTPTLPALRTSCQVTVGSRRSVLALPSVLHPWAFLAPSLDHRRRQVPLLPPGRPSRSGQDSSRSIRIASPVQPLLR